MFDTLSFLIDTMSSCLIYHDTFSFQVKSKPNVDLGDDTSLCGTASISLISNVLGNKYLWSTSDTLNSINLDSTGTYWLSLTDTNGCKGSDTISIQYISQPYINIGSDSCLSNGESINLIIDSISGGSLIWSTGDTTINASISTTGKYWVEVSNGICNKRDTISVTYCDLNVQDVFVPNAFSPNGDGNNDMFRIKGSGIADILIQIFDRWGNRVFHSSDINFGWDGTSKGNVSNEGVYAYHIIGKYISGKTISLKGNLNLIK